MAIEMVRVPSDTPNISNIDDFVGLRYSYGNQNGFVAGKGTECSYSINGSKFRINSGRLVLQGIECDIDANGVELQIDDVSTTRYFTVFLQVNLALNEAKVFAQYDTATYPTIEIGDDLTQNTSGVARLPLYQFMATSGEISSVVKIVSKLNYYGTSLEGYNYSKGTIENRLEKVETPLSSYDNSKGTIENRLTNLGFKEGNIIDSSNNIVGKIKRQGNYVLMNFNSAISISSSSDKLFDISVSSSSGYNKSVFYPQDEQKRILHIQDGGGGMLFGFVEKNGNKPIRFASTIAGAVYVSEYNLFGWEAPPIQ